MKEIWKDIKGYEGFYQVSNLGRVKSLKRVARNNHRVRERILKTYIDKDGYIKCCLCKEGKRKPLMVHRLVAKAFIPNVNNYPVVNHKDEVKDNNKVENLEWCTHKYNVNYGTSNKRKSYKLKGEKNPMYGMNGVKNPVSKMVVLLNNGMIFESVKDAAKHYGLSDTLVSCICRGVKRTAKTDHEGKRLEFMYYDDFIKQKEGN